MSTTTPVIALDHPAALDAARVGRKAADLAAARAAGLPVGPGVVLTTDWATDDAATVGQVWRIASHDGARPLTVRRSPTGRRRAGTPDCSGGDGAVGAPTAVTDLDSLLGAVAALRAADRTTPILLQPHTAGSWAGVRFADGAGSRVTSVVAARRTDHGDTGDWVAELDPAGRVLAVITAAAPAGPPAELLARLARLGARVDAAFGEPHDIDWVADDDGRLQLLRVRPVVRLRVTTGARPGASAGRRRLDSRVRHRIAAHRGAHRAAPRAGARVADESAA